MGGIQGLNFKKMRIIKSERKIRTLSRPNITGNGVYYLNISDGYEQLPVNTQCSEGMFISNIDECAKAVAYLTITSTQHPIKDVNLPVSPKGCYQTQSVQLIYFNTHATGSKNSGRTPICALITSGKQPFF